MSQPSASGVYTASQYDYYTPGLDRHFWTWARNRIVERHMRRCLNSIGEPQAAILDIGCGAGITVQHLRQKGLACYGVEPGDAPIWPGAAAFVTTNTEPAGLAADLRGRIRVAMLLDVLEHLDDPAAYLKALPEVLPNLRAIVATVPARKELWSNFDEHYGHRQRYTLSTFREIVDSTPFSLQTLKYFFAALYPPMLAISRFSKSGRATETAAPKGAVAFAHGVLGGWFVAEERLPFGRMPGTSILAVMTVV